MTKEARLHNGKETTSSISGAGKTGQLCVKELNQNAFVYHTQRLTENGLKT